MLRPLKILFLANWPLRDAGQGAGYAFFSQWKKPPKLTLMGTGNLGAWTRFERFRLRFYIFAPLIAFFRSIANDVVIAYSSQVGLPLALMFRLGFRRKTRLVVFDVETFGRPRGHRLSLVKFAAERIDRIVYASSRQKEFYDAHLPQIGPRLRYVPIGIGRYDKRLPLGEPGRGPVVAPGHHGKAFRDWATLLRAFGPLADRAELLIAGRESLPAEERDGVAIPDRCRFEPFLPIGEFQRRIENAPFVVLPLPERGQSLGQLTTLFCMAMGKAVIGTRVMGIEDYIEDGVTGLLVPPGDDQALRAAMNRLLDDPAEAAGMGVEGHKRIAEKYNDHVMGLAWEDLIDSSSAG